jgi:hypothetical protein
LILVDRESRRSQRAAKHLGTRRGNRFISEETDRDAAKRGDRQIERHAHAVDRATQHHALAMQIDDAQPLVSGFVDGFETHRQSEWVEPEREPRRARALGLPDAAQPGSGPAGLHLTPQKCRTPPGLLSPGCRHRAIGPWPSA